MSGSASSPPYLGGALGQPLPGAAASADGERCAGTRRSSPPQRITRPSCPSLITTPPPPKRAWTSLYRPHPPSRATHHWLTGLAVKNRASFHPFFFFSYMRRSVGGRVKARVRTNCRALEGLFFSGPPQVDAPLIPSEWQAIRWVSHPGPSGAVELVQRMRHRTPVGPINSNINIHGIRLFTQVIITCILLIAC